MIINKVLNKHTHQEVCKNYTNKKIRNIVHIIGNELYVKFESGSYFTHETVLNTTEDDFGLLIETTNKLWRINYL